MLKAKAQEFLSYLEAPVPGASLLIFRVLFGAVIVWEMLRYWSYGWIHRYYIAPEFNFTYYGFSWVKPFNELGMYLVFSAVGLCGVLVILGICYRLAMALSSLGLAYIFLLEKAHYLNHFYMFVVMGLLMTFLPLGRLVESVKPWRIKKVPRYALVSLTTMVGLVYFFGGLAKVNRDWLAGYPLKIWMPPKFTRWGFGHLDLESIAHWMSISGMLIDLCAWPCLLWRRSRPIAVGFLVAFHLMNATIFSIGIFPWLMMAALILFLKPHEWRAGRIFPEGVGLSSDQGVKQRIFISCVLAILLVQHLMPLRYIFYQGDVAWTENGHRFAWRMKLRSKRGRLWFYGVDAETGAIVNIDHRQRLSSRQVRKMKTRPDMILEYAHYEHQLYRQKTGRELKVYVDSTVSLNGRPYKQFVNPNIDLARVDDSFLGAWAFIMPER